MVELSPLLAELVADALAAARETDGRSTRPSARCWPVSATTATSPRSGVQAAPPAWSCSGTPAGGRSPSTGTCCGCLAGTSSTWGRLPRPPPPTGARGSCTTTRHRRPRQPGGRHRHGRTCAARWLAGGRAGPAGRRTPADRGCRPAPPWPPRAAPGAPGARAAGRGTTSSTRPPAAGRRPVAQRHRRRTHLPARQHGQHGRHGQGRPGADLAAQHRPPARLVSHEGGVVTLGGWPREVAA